METPNLSCSGRLNSLFWYVIIFLSSSSTCSLNRSFFCVSRSKERDEDRLTAGSNRRWCKKDIGLRLAPGSVLRGGVGGSVM